MKAEVISSLFAATWIGLLSSAAQNIMSASPPSLATAVSTGLPSAPVPLSAGAEEISELAEAGVNPETLQSFIQNSYLDYDLDAAGIDYLRQQGVSDAVISAMLQKAGDALGEVRTAARQNWHAARLAYDWRTWPQTMPRGVRGFPVRTEEAMPYDYYDHYYNDTANVYYFPYPVGHPASNRRAEWENGLYRRWLGHQYFIGNPGFSGGAIGGGGARR